MGEFGALYAHVNRMAEEDPAVRSAVLNETAKLHQGIPKTSGCGTKFARVPRRHRAIYNAWA